MKQINLTPGETMLRLRIGRTKLYQLLASGELRHFRVGRKIMVPVASVAAFERGERKGARR